MYRDPNRKPDAVLHEEELEIERKRVKVQLRENPRGQFVRIMEESNGHFNSVNVPVAGLEGFIETLARMDGAARRTGANA